MLNSGNRHNFKSAKNASVSTLKTTDFAAEIRKQSSLNRFFEGKSVMQIK